MITIEQLKDVKERTEALHRYLDIDNKKVQVEEEQLRTQAPGFWDDAKKAEAQTGGYPASRCRTGLKVTTK